ncbi:MAG: RNase adapter RapZ [Bacteroidota bacterium]
MDDIIKSLSSLYAGWCGCPATTLVKLAGSGSYRTYYRIFGQGGTVVGVHNDNFSENLAFIAFSRQFLADGLPVPEVLAENAGQRIYLLSDLGDQTLFQLLTAKRSPEDHFPAEIVALYKKAIDWLVVFQVKAGKNIDYGLCYPRAVFDRQSMMWDLNYFKYYFLKLAKVPFDEQALEDDFTALCDLLTEDAPEFFLYRDFQSRNIMILDGEPWFIDYQGGRKGALQYDLASLLTDAKADIPFPVRGELLRYYLGKLEEAYPVDRERFLKNYYGFVLIRILQALGAYGFRGYYENKAHFLQSIPFAFRNLRYLREQGKIGFGLDSLMEVIDQMISGPDIYLKDRMHSALTVTINSFSYKKAIPQDTSGHGGGFVFDCRALPNPGRFEEYRRFTGMDQPVIDFLKSEPPVEMFLNHVFALVGQSVHTYGERGFEHLMVSFGCTGGQHRSVYCAQQLAAYLKEHYRVATVVRHLEQEGKSNVPA